MSAESVGPRHRLRRAVAVGLCLAALFGGGLPRPVLAAPVTPGQIQTPVLSLRRAPSFLAHLVAVTGLDRDLDRAVGDPGVAAQSTCLVVRDPDGRTLFSSRPTTALIPASTLKLITAATVLARIGPGERLVTDVRATGPPVDGAVKDLYLVGGGDPLLATADFAIDGGFGGQPRLATPMEELADRVVSAGVRRVEGRILGDDSRYDRQRFLPTWPLRYLTSLEISPVSALVVNKSILVGARPPAFSTDPAIHAANILSNLLMARGVSVSGTGEGTAPAAATKVASIQSPPITDVLAEVLQNSDNLGAEMLVKELGMRLRGSGSTQAGREVIADYFRERLAKSGVDAQGFVAVDGSGLDRSDRVSCVHLQQVLSEATDQGPLARALPVAGFSGTLFKRFSGSAAAGRVRAKTGSLEGVVGLGGWTSGVDNRPLQFVLLANGISTARVGSALQDRVVDALARYPQSPPLEQLQPAPLVR